MDARRRAGGRFASTGSVLTIQRPSTRFETFVGRALAVSIHPVAAWRTRSRRDVAVLVGAYFAAGYLAILATLFLL
jgi:hypothetical protein